jgi:hypothetical protein
MALQQLAEASLADVESEQLKAAWNDAMASNAIIADFAAMLNSDFPIVNDLFRNLLNEALEEHNTLVGLAGGTHIGQAANKTGKALASPWNKDSKLNKKQRIAAETAEVGLVGAGVFFGGRAAGRAIFAAGEKRQLWGAINTKVGGKDGPSIKDMISGDLPGGGQGPHFKVPAGDREQVLGDIIKARDALIEKSGPLSKAEETQLYNNARAILRPGGEIDGSSGAVVNKIEYLLHPDSDYRDMALMIHNNHIASAVPEFARDPIQELENELEKNGIDISQISQEQLDNKFANDPLRPPAGAQEDEFNLLRQFTGTQTALNLNMKLGNGPKNDFNGWTIDVDNPSFVSYANELGTLDKKLAMLSYARQTGLTIPEFVSRYGSCTDEKYSQELKELAELEKTNYENALNGLDSEGNPISKDNTRFMDVTRNMHLGVTFGSNPEYEKELQDMGLEVPQHIPKGPESTAKLFEQPNFLNDHFKASRLGNNVKISNTDDVRHIKRANYETWLQTYHVDHPEDYERIRGDLGPGNEVVDKWRLGATKKSGFPRMKMDGPPGMTSDFRREIFGSDINQTGLRYFAVKHSGPKSDVDGTPIAKGPERIQKFYVAEGDHALTAQEFSDKFKDDYHDLETVNGFSGGPEQRGGFAKGVFDNDGLLIAAKQIRVKKNFTGKGILKSSTPVDPQELEISNAIGQREATAAKYIKGRRPHFMAKKNTDDVSWRDHFKNEPTAERAEEIQSEFHSYLRSINPRRLAVRATRDEDALSAQRTKPSEGQRQEVLVGDQPRNPLNVPADQVAGIDRIAGSEIRSLDAEAVNATDRMLRDTEVETAEGINNLESDVI